MFITTRRLICALFAILLIGAAVFSFERVLFADASFILFRLINSGTLQIQEHRYGSFLTQSVPLLAAYLHLPLVAIVVLYSISFTLFYLAAALLLLFYFRQKELAVLMSFYFVLFVSDSFFWMNNEVHQGIAWMFLFFAFTITSGRKKTAWMITVPVFTLLAFLTLYTHPLLLFPASYLWLFFIGKKDWPFSRRQTLLLTAILAVTALSKLYLSAHATSPYDAEKLQSIRNLTWKNTGDILRSQFTKELLARMIWNYWLVLLLFVTGILAAARKKLWWQAALTAGFSILSITALAITFQDFTPFYTESELMPLTVILTTPFVFYLLTGWKEQKQVIILGLIFLVRLSYIAAASPKWIERKEWLFSTLETMRRQHITKGVIYLNEEISEQLQLYWSAPNESMIASALAGEKPQRTFVVEKIKNLPERMPADKQTMIGSFEQIPASELNKVYFSIDTTGNYQVLNIR